MQGVVEVFCEFDTARRLWPKECFSREAGWKATDLILSELAGSGPFKMIISPKLAPGPGPDAFRPFHVPWIDGAFDA